MVWQRQGLCLCNFYFTRAILFLKKAVLEPRCLKSAPLQTCSGEQKQHLEWFLPGTNQHHSCSVAHFYISILAPIKDLWLAAAALQICRRRLRCAETNPMLCVCSSDEAAAIWTEDAAGGPDASTYWTCIILKMSCFIFTV